MELDDFTFSIDPGVAIGAAGTLIAVIQIYLGLRRERFKATIDIIERLQSDAARNMRFKVTLIMEKQEAIKGNFDCLSSEERAALSGISSIFGLASLLMRTKRVETKLFMEMYAHSLILNFEKIEPYYRWRVAAHGSSEATLWQHFEYGYKRCLKHLNRKPGETLKQRRER